MRHRSLAVAALGCLVLALGACSSPNTNSDAGYIHIEEGATETQGAQTQAALATATPTLEPAGTPLPSGTPYVIPTNPPAVDASTVITRVGRQDITLAEYQKRVRFERYDALYKLLKAVETGGAEKVLDLTNQDNWYVGSVFTTLADSYSFGAQVQRILVIEAIAQQEALRREMDVNPVQFDAKLAEYLGLQVGGNGQLPPEFDQRYAEFLQGIRTYANMSEEEFRRIVRAQTLYSQLQFLISQEPDAVPTPQNLQAAREVEDITLASQAVAETIGERMRSGEALANIVQALGYRATSPNESRVLQRSDQSLPAEVVNAIFNAQMGDVVGPLQVPQGWYVAHVRREVTDSLTPEQIQDLRKRHVLNWVGAQMDDPAYVQDMNNWIGQTPQEPLPQDVSPLLRDENVRLPEGTLNPNDIIENPDLLLTPTP